MVKNANLTGNVLFEDSKTYMAEQTPLVNLSSIKVLSNDLLGDYVCQANCKLSPSGEF